MRWALWGTVLALCAAGAATAGAEPLTCATFKDRLDAALLASADNDAAAVVTKPAFKDPVRGTRYDWTDGTLGGALSCGPADQFQEFGISLEFRTKETFAAMLKRFGSIQGASICALSSAGTDACEAAGRGVLREALEKMGDAYRRGAKAPSGLADRTLFPGANAEVTSASTLLTFLIGPGRGNTIEATRMPLQPQPQPSAE